VTALVASGTLSPEHAIACELAQRWHMPPHEAHAVVRGLSHMDMFMAWAHLYAHTPLSEVDAQVLLERYGLAK
jgi:hypothetical protein